MSTILSDFDATASSLWDSAAIGTEELVSFSYIFFTIKCNHSDFQLNKEVRTTTLTVFSIGSNLVRTSSVLDYADI